MLLDLFIKFPLNIIYFITFNVIVLFVHKICKGYSSLEFLKYNFAL